MDARSTTMMQDTDTGRVKSPSSVPRRRRRLGRTHAINLCCAQSVAAIVEEIARHLRGLGFTVGVSCGAEARAALLGRDTSAAVPTIHVVCVQGSLQERVLKPLRQALATHGGAHQHLFVGVLDLAMPLTMVGQIRRFAEALEHTPAAPIRVRDHLGERRRWREHFGHRELAELPTRNYPIVPDRRPSGPHATLRETPGKRSGARTIGTRSRPVRIVPTAKNRQVTAPHASVGLERPQRLRARGVPPGDTSRDAITTKGEVALPPITPAPPPAVREPEPSGGGATRLGAVAHAIVAAHEAVKAQVAETRERVEAAVLADEQAEARGAAASVTSPLARLPDTQFVGSAVREPPAAAIAEAQARPFGVPMPAPVPARRWPVALGGCAAVGIALFVWRPWSGSTAAVAEPFASTASADGSSPAGPKEARARAAAPDPAALAHAPDPDETPASPASDERDEPEPEPAQPDARGSARATVEPGLADALAERRVVTVGNLYVSRRPSDTVSWSQARTRCNSLAIDGVDGWRLPWRRELKLIGVGTRLGEGTYWSHSVPDDQPDQAWAYDPNTRALSLVPKDGPGSEVVCVKPMR